MEEREDIFEILAFAEFVFGRWQIKDYCQALQNQAGNMTDPIADMINRIKNAQVVRKETVEVPFSKIRFEIGKILERTNFLKKVELKTKKSKRLIELILEYKEGRPKIIGVKRVSKPGKRVYAPVAQLGRVTKENGIGIISTSKGLMTVGEARAQGLGGEILCEIW